MSRNPPTSGGGGMPEWVLHRPEEPLPGWHGNHLIDLSARLDKPDTAWVTDLTVMATRRVATVQVRYAGEVINLSVPPGGLVTVPHAIRHVHDSAEFRGFDASGGLIAVTQYRPLTDDDRMRKWPDPSLWTS
ncbi:hypothetical protein [Nonomuraea cavernae]|uniref:hypothetical protein n=1 Tax=Nonomuraea cavernae TaxID=2045107 RepID=UPI0033CF1572